MFKLYTLEILGERCYLVWATVTYLMKVSKNLVRYINENKYKNKNNTVLREQEQAPCQICVRIKISITNSTTKDELKIYNLRTRVFPKWNPQ